MKKQLCFIICLCIFFSVSAHAPLYELTLAHKTDAASTILEARVIRKKSFWNNAHTLIHTAYTLEVYKVFKGQMVQEEIILIAEGGQLGSEMHVVDPGVELTLNEVGLFFLQSPRVFAPDIDEQIQYMPYGGIQAVTHYDEWRGFAYDFFHRYRRIEDELYRSIERQLAKPYRKIQLYSFGERFSQSQSRATPTFTNITPGSATAGTDSVITITGNNFNAYDGGTNSIVYFSNANDGGGSLIAATNYHVVSWNNTTIEVRVPSGACTGQIAVQNSTSETGLSGGITLTVTYNLSNVSFGGNAIRPQLRDANGTGGYDMVYSTNTADNGIDFSTSSGVAPFNRALSTWNCESLLNVETTGATTTSNTVAAGTAPNIIMFDNDVAPLASGTLGVCYSGYSSCDGGLTWYIFGFDIVFKRSGTDGINWNFGPVATTGGNYDFESVALHEIGHAHGIGHINDAGAVMHYAVGPNTDNRTLDPTVDVDAGEEVIDFSRSLVTCSGSVTGTTDYSCVLPFGVSMFGRHRNGSNHLHWELPESSVWRSQQIQRYDPLYKEYRTLQTISLGDDCEYDCSYELQDYLLVGEQSEYRLAMTDLNGQIELSNPVIVTHPSVLPDVKWHFERSAQQLICYLSFASSEQTQFQVFDIHGRQIQLRTKQRGSGEWRL
ncbi:MAG: matrixin family metalloprotease, partial [Bacteroidota bacterium]